MHNIPQYYKLSDGRIWSVVAAAFVAADAADVVAYHASGAAFGTAPDDAGELTEAGLRAALAFYNFPLGALVPMAEATSRKRAEIAAGFTAAMAASLTMPSTGAPPSVFEVASALFEWRTEDPEGYADLLAIHETRREALLAAVEAADTADAVQAIEVDYAV